MKTRVLLIGSAGIDLVLPMGYFPRAGETMFGEGYQMLPGGKALVSAMTLAEMGIEPMICSVIGEDAEGMRVKQFCQDMGLACRFLFSSKEANTAVRVMMVDQAGGRHTVRYQGADITLTAEQLEDAFTCLPDALYLQGELPEELIQMATQYARDQEIPVFFDPGDATVVRDYSALGRLEIFTPSEDEMDLLASSRLRTQDEIMRACLQMASKVDARYYVLKLGSRGSILYDGTYYKLVTAYEVDKVDNCGVGDIFTAILVAEYMKHQDVRRAMEYANAGAALSVTRRGSIGSIPHYEEIQQVVRENVEVYQ